VSALQVSLVVFAFVFEGRPRIVAHRLSCAIWSPRVEPIQSNCDPRSLTIIPGRADRSRLRNIGDYAMSVDSPFTGCAEATTNGAGAGIDGEGMLEKLAAM
jgi:hypothetical protein